jgi:broad specificity phosphatase PhoE
MRALQEALRTEREALLASMQSLVDFIRGEVVYRASNLTSAHQTVEDRAQELGADPIELPEVHEEKMRRFLVHLDVRRDLVLRHRAIEDWLAEWQAAEQSQGSRASLDASSE